ncbi:hypothetical protein [Bradyrhizobium sp. RT4b]|uniref:hypothetical protein n=1 Tax=unclassified Bradyrhizobium TaxID=2631580 RepID=UPI00339A110D
MEADHPDQLPPMSSARISAACELRPADKSQSSGATQPLIQNEPNRLAQLKGVRRHIKSIQGWQVTEPVTLATQSFTK